VKAKGPTFSKLLLVLNLIIVGFREVRSFVAVWLPGKNCPDFYLHNYAGKNV
jgi:hypothetical protein